MAPSVVDNSYKMQISFITDNAIMDDTSTTNEDNGEDTQEWQRAWGEFGTQLKDRSSRIIIMPHETFERLGEGGQTYFQEEASDILRKTAHFFIDASNTARVYLANPYDLMEKVPCVITQAPDSQFAFMMPTENIPMPRLSNPTPASVSAQALFQPPPPPPSRFAEPPRVHSNPPTPIDLLNTSVILYNGRSTRLDDYFSFRSETELDGDRYGASRNLDESPVENPKKSNESNESEEYRKRFQGGLNWSLY